MTYDGWVILKYIVSRVHGELMPRLVWLLLLPAFLLKLDSIPTGG